MKYFYLPLAITVFGCTPLQSYNSNSRYANFIGSCYEIKRDSYLYSLEYCKNDADKCYSIQAFNNNYQDSDLPKSEIDFEVSPIKFLENIKHLARISGLEPINLGGFAKKGFKFKVRDIFYGDLGSLGPFWYVSIEFEDPLLKGKSVFVPTPHKYLYPSWTKISSLEQGPVWDSDFVQKCTNEN